MPAPKYCRKPSGCGSPFSLCHFLQQPEQAEHSHKKTSRHENEEDPGPELHCDDTGRVRVPRVHLRIGVVPHERAAAFGADGMEFRISITALRAGEWLPAHGCASGQGKFPGVVLPETYQHTAASARKRIPMLGNPNMR